MSALHFKQHGSRAWLTAIAKQWADEQARGVPNARWRRGSAVGRHLILRDLIGRHDRFERCLSEGCNGRTSPIIRTRRTR